jgi:hypothetical protein
LDDQTQYSILSVMKIDDRKIIVDHIIDQRFVPALMKKIMPFVDELVEKRIFVIDYTRNIGMPIATEQTVLDLKPELEKLSKDICLIIEKS